ncbi:hypothetical protein J0X15_11365 [Roseibium sp. CAU 1637]|uniref:Uncharacterized protein n=1 Tax=Roseibium limicola TaxID=2816037 RepID=A0A939J9E7_9HYPH|nr:hypothetical protein [Roseibium limicola]MBO0345819.1 hypothetical protein [Roseibium limicola]
MPSSPLQNRVLPTGEIIATSSRGLFFGNRGGRLHDPSTRILLSRRWTSKRWICCCLSFKGRQRQVMGPGYTELFFLDEVTALASGHRPCFECRRQDAKAFGAAFSQGQDAPAPLKADAIDMILHEERLARPRPFLVPDEIKALPDGTMVLSDDQVLALRDGASWAWSEDGYRLDKPIAELAKIKGASVELVTPPSIVAALRHGFQPAWHPSAA